MTSRPRLYISAAHKSSGKTTLAIGLCAALSEFGSIIYPFKKGPDYIDPMWLSRASGRPCYNLDFNTQTSDEIEQLFMAKSGADGLSIIEGNKGLYDGLDVEGSDSNAARGPRQPHRVDIVWTVHGNETEIERWPTLVPEPRQPADENMRLEDLLALWSGELKHDYAEASVVGTLAIVLKAMGQASSIEMAEQLALEMWGDRDKSRFPKVA